MMENNDKSQDVLVVGAGIAGIEASLALAKADRNVHVVERTGFIGGTMIKFEDVYPNLECSTCMVAPKQQAMLAQKNIDLITPAEVDAVEGAAGDFTVEVTKRARYVDAAACIGCGMCIDACPVVLPNLFEEELTERKAIYIPCPGALPNVPVLDMSVCVRSDGEDCTACKDSCMFEAVDFEQKDETRTLEVGAIIVATGFELYDATQEEGLGYGEIEDVYTGFEFERLFASNGPTEGEIVRKNGEPPRSAAIVHCIGREKSGYCSGICCGYSAKFGHYLRQKLPEITIYDLHTDICIPGKNLESFINKTAADIDESIRYTDIAIGNGNGDSDADEGSDSDSGDAIAVEVTDRTGEKRTLTVDMMILAPAVVPRADAGELAEMVGIDRDTHGFFVAGDDGGAGGIIVRSVETTKPGVLSIGCARGPKTIQRSISDADAAAARVIALLAGEGGV